MNEEAADPGIGERVLIAARNAVASNPAEIQARVDRLKSKNPHASQEEIATWHADRACWLYAGQGAATALPSAIPGLGTLTQVGVEATAILTDVAFLMRNQANLSMGVAAAFGHPLNEQARIDEFSVLLAIWCGIVRPAQEGLKLVGKKIAVAQIKKVPGSFFTALNRRVGTTVLTKYGTKRGGIAVGRVVPFGVGVIVGGTFNLMAMKAFKRVAIKFYRDDLPGGGEYVLD